MIHHRGSVVPVAGRRVTIAWEDAINQDVTKGSAAIACMTMVLQNTLRLPLFVRNATPIPPLWGE